MTPRRFEHEGAVWRVETTGVSHSVQSNAYDLEKGIKFVRVTDGREVYGSLSAAVDTLTDEQLREALQLVIEQAKNPLPNWPAVPDKDA